MAQSGSQGTHLVVGRTEAYWLEESDFVCSREGFTPARDLGPHGFPRDWPKAYTASRALKSLLGKKGSLGAQRVRVVPPPEPEALEQVSKVELLPVQSFENAERVARCTGMAVEKGWAVYELFSRPPEGQDPPGDGEFIAQKHWFNRTEAGEPVDFTPRGPTGSDAAKAPLLLVDVAEPTMKERRVLTSALRELYVRCLTARGFPTPSRPPAAAVAPPPPRKIVPLQMQQQETGSAPTPAAASSAPPRVVKEAPRRAERPTATSSTEAAKPPKRGIDYSKFDGIEDSDEEREKATKQQQGRGGGGDPNRATARVTSTPTERVSLQDYCEVFRALLDKADPPTVAPDLEQMFKSLQACPDTTDRALLDQACHAVEEISPAMMQHGIEGWRKGTAQMAQAMLHRQRFDEARMWCVIRHMVCPSETEPLNMHAWCLEEQWAHLLNRGEPKVRMPGLSRAEIVDVDVYADALQVALRAMLRRVVSLSSPGQLPAPAFAGLAASLERSGDVDAARKVGREGVSAGIWLEERQRPAHFVPNLAPRKAWHEAETLEVCAGLEQVASSIQEEFERYMSAGLDVKHVGVRSGEAMLVERGSWKEVALFNNGRMDHEVCSKFPETVRMLTERCADATGLAFCGGGEISFRILSPGTKLKPHCGPTNVRLTCQLGISIPLGGEPGIVVSGESPRVWKEGKCIVFDDSFEHYEELDEMAEGDSVVLTVHFWHPAFPHKNDPEWKSKGLQHAPSPDGAALFTPMGTLTSSDEGDLPPID